MEFLIHNLISILIGAFSVITSLAVFFAKFSVLTARVEALECRRVEDIQEVKAKLAIIEGDIKTLLNRHN